MLQKFIKKEIIDFYKPIILKHKSLFLLMAFGGAITGLSNVFMPVLLKMETDQLVEKKALSFYGNDFSSFEIFVMILGIILLVNIIQKLLVSITDIFASSKQDFIRNELQLNLFKNMKDMEVGIAMSQRYKYISDVVRQDFHELSSTIINLPKSVIQFFIQLFGLAIVYTYFDYRLLIIVVISALVGYFITLFSRRISEKYEVEWKFSLGRQEWKFSHLFFANFPQLALSGGVNSSIQNYSKILDSAVENSFKRRISSMIWDINSLINYNIRDLILKLIVGYGVFKGTNSVGMVVLVVSSMDTVGEIVSQIFDLKISYRNFMFSQETIRLILNVSKPVGSENFSEKVENISLKNIKFSYPNLAKYEHEYFELAQKYLIGKEKSNTRKGNWLDDKIEGMIETIKTDSKTEFPEILSGVNLNFEKGKVYGIVGKNGAGKTTSMYLLSGFFRNFSGEIFFNGKNMKDVKTSEFLNKVSFLTQIPFMLDYGSTLRENLFLGVSENFPEEKAFEYLEKFGIAKKINKSKKGLDSELGSDIDLSGGEKQLIAFIRLLMQNRDIIIMDEGTNQLDAENELLVMSEFLKQKEDKIIIFITHRMSTVSRADLIYCLENGIITHKGTHKELLAENENIYSRFYKAQILPE